MRPRLMGDGCVSGPERIRRDKGLTQEQLAVLCGFSQQYLSGLERGRRNPTIVTIYEIATALGGSHIDLLAEKSCGPIIADDGGL